MNLALFKANIRLNWFLFLIFTAILFMYLSIMISMYDPADIDAIAGMYELMPQGIIEAFGFAATATDLVSFVGLYYYGFIVLLFPLIYCILLSNRLVANLVDRGSMAYLLATPNRRTAIAGTQAAYMAGSLTLLMLLNMLAGLAFSQALFPGELDWGLYLHLNLVTVMLTLAISSICFFFSCLFNEARYSLVSGGGIPLFFFLIKTLSNVSGSYDWLQYLTIYSLYDPSAIVAGEANSFMSGLVFGLISLCLYGAGVFFFSRRNLYL